MTNLRTETGLTNSLCMRRNMYVDEELADVVWELWDARSAPDELVAIAWWLMASDRSGQAF